MERKTLTLKPENVYPIIDLHPADRLLVYDALIGEFLLGKHIDFSQYPDTAKTALYCLKPQLKKLQSQFNNGRKNKPIKTTASLCPFDDSQTKPSKANSARTRACHLDKININNIYNTNQTTACAGTRERDKNLKEINDGDGQAVAKAPATTDDQAIVQKFLHRLQKLESVKINGMPTPAVKVACNIEQLCARPDAKAILQGLFEDMRANSENITNKTNYAISALYNTELRLQRADEASKVKIDWTERYMKHNYTEEQLREMFPEFYGELDDQLFI